MSAKIVKAGVAVIVRKDDKVLVGKRKGAHGSGLWAFPGGHIETTDKSLKACGEREVLEETGIICNVFSPDKFRQDLFTTFDILSDDGSKQYVTCYLIADYLYGGSSRNDDVLPKEPDKCDMWHWKTIPELVELLIQEKNSGWIPINLVVNYLQQLQGVKS